MTICGYHHYMGEGLRRFGEGLSAALAEKASLNSRHMRDQLFHELDEIQLLTQHLESVLAHSADDREREAARGFLGLVYVCRFLMADLNNIEEMQSSLSQFIGDNGERLIAILQAFESKFEDTKVPSSVIRARAAWNEVKYIE